MTTQLSIIIGFVILSAAYALTNIARAIITAKNGKKLYELEEESYDLRERNMERILFVQEKIAAALGMVCEKIGNAQISITGELATTRRMLGHMKCVEDWDKEKMKQILEYYTSTNG